VIARIAALVALCALTARPLAAQALRYVGGDAGVARVRLKSAWPGGGETLSGVAAQGQARLILGPVSLEVSYAQGRLSADTGAGGSSDLVDGSVFVALRPVSWLAVKGGPHLRAYVAPSGTERWVMWESRVRAEGPIIAGTLFAHVEGRLALSSSVNVAPGASGARGGEAGLTLRGPQSPLWARLAYVVEQAQLVGNARTETVEAVMLGIGIGGR
jgi:hypothetical protein